MKPIHKLNNGLGATLCNKCSVIITTGLTEDLYCERCEPKQETLEEAIQKDFPFVYDKKEKSLLIRGAKWQQESSNINALDFEIKALKSLIQDMDATIKSKYSYEDMIKFISFVGKNYVKAKGFYYMKGDFEKSMKLSIHQILEQFKNK